ncbi:unnamed protein product [Heterobilharzia americana]|nr:unnamed protein product [Heterobilharzia americana]CAH8576732.1 unnamed protein product [Heterobilharzia americana]
MAQNLQGLLRLAIQNSESAPVEVMDPKDAAWLKDALTAHTVDLSKQLTEDVRKLSSYLSSSEPDLNEMKNIIEDLLTLTEDIDLSNDFLVVGGQEVLLKLLFCGPLSLRTDALRLLGNLTQNNPKAQSLFTENGVLARLLLLIEESKDLEFLRYLFLAISCLTRGYMPGIDTFIELDGINLLLDALIQQAETEKPENIQRLVDRGAFIIHCVLRELSPKRLPADSTTIVDKLMNLMCRLDNPQEHLLASLTILYPSDDSSSYAQDVHPKELYKSFFDWLKRQSDELNKINDPADEERRDYINCLLKTIHL